MGKGGAITCRSCEANDAYLVFDYRYRGLRGQCDHCFGNWPES